MTSTPMLSQHPPDKQAFLQSSDTYSSLLPSAIRLPALLPRRLGRSGSSPGCDTSEPSHLLWVRLATSQRHVGIGHESRLLDVGRVPKVTVTTVT